MVDEEVLNGVSDGYVGGFGFGEVVRVGFRAGMFHSSGGFGSQVGACGVC